MILKPIELFIGLRYTRAKRRNRFVSSITLASVLGTALGVTTLITVLSVMNGFEREVRDRILAMTAHGTISTSTKQIRHWEQLAAAVTQNPKVIAAAPYIEAEGMLRHGKNMQGVLIQGILPAEEKLVSEIGQMMSLGELKNLQADRHGIILGAELARTLGIGLGDKVTLVSSKPTDHSTQFLPQLSRFTVVGVFTAGMSQYDAGLALIHLADAQHLFGKEDEVSGIRLRLEDRFRSRLVMQEVMDALDENYLVSDWTRRHLNYFSALQTQKRVMFVIFALIVAVSAFNLVSTLVMVVIDKTADIAILRTLGMAPIRIMGIFIVQGTIIGTVGILVGVIGGVILALNVATMVAAVERLFNTHFLSADIYYIDKLPSDLRWSDVSFVGVVAMVLTVLATLYPAWQAAHVQPAKALRYK